MEMQDLTSIINNIQNDTGGGDKYKIWKEGVNTHNLRPKKGGAQQMFWLLPGVPVVNGAPQSDDPMAWYHHITDTDNNTLNPSLGGVVGMHSEVGRGDWKSREDIISLQSWNEECPAALVHNFAVNNADWTYLTEKVKETPTSYPKAVLPAMEHVFLTNIVLPPDTVGESYKHYMGVLKRSTITALTGAIMQMGVVTAEAIAQNPMARYVLGDVTNPGAALALVVHLPPKARGHVIEYYQNEAGQPLQQAMTEFLPNRYKVYDLDQVVIKPSPQDTVDKLTRLLKGTNAKGQHEYALLHAALGHLGLNLPEVPPTQQVAAPVGLPGQQVAAPVGLPGQPAAAAAATLPGMTVQAAATQPAAAAAVQPTQATVTPAAGGIIGGASNSGNVAPSPAQLATQAAATTAVTEPQAGVTAASTPTELTGSAVTQPAAQTATVAATTSHSEGEVQPAAGNGGFDRNQFFQNLNVGDGGAAQG